MRYFCKKVISLIITLLAISFLVFFAFSIIPGDPAQAQLGTEATPEMLEALRTEMGLDKPLLERYISWIGGICHGDFGMSYKYKVPVTDLIGDKLPITLIMAVISFLIIVVVSLPIGSYTTKHNGKLADRIITVVNQVLMAVPGFFMGILLTYVFGLVLKLFTPGNFVSYKEDWGEFLGYIIFPCIAMALPKIAMSVKIMKSACLKEMNKDYVRTAYSKGNNTIKVLHHHVIKNAMIPVVTLWGMVLADLIVGSIVIEQVFNIPGLGRILITSISYRDYPVVEAIIVFIAFVVMMSSFLVDMIYQWLDPRVRTEA